MSDAEWVPLMRLDEIEPDDVTGAVRGGHDYAVYCVDGEYYVTDALCTHNQANLCDGYLDGYVIECPLHQGCFDVRTGEPRGAPATEPLKIHACVVEGDLLNIRIAADD